MFNIDITPFDINDDVPTNNEIATAVRNLRNGKAPGPSGLRAEYLKTLLHQAEKDNATDNKCRGWEQVCSTIKLIFAMGNIPEEMTWSILVLIPKASGGTRGIGLLEIIWKVCSSIINKCLQESIQFHDLLHGFRKGRGTGTASIDAKLQMQHAHIRGIPLYQIFFDLSKAYDTLDRNQTLQLLQKYGVGNRILQLLTNFWHSLTIMARQQGYHGDPFKSERGTMQGDIVSPTIFNVVIDAVVCAWYHEMDTVGISHAIRAIFYADDGHLYSTDADKLQQATELMVTLFECMGLKTNPAKTKAMICAPQPSITRICLAYKCRMGDHNEEDTYNARKRRLVECDICNACVQTRSLFRHKRTKHGIGAAYTNYLTTPSHLAGIGHTYEISMPEYRQPGTCPVPGCEAIITD
jgi:hypothetical protein